jgi:hypothetical protein
VLPFTIVLSGRFANFLVSVNDLISPKMHSHEILSDVFVTIFKIRQNDHFQIYIDNNG